MVTGSCTLVETAQTRLLVDCGLIQGSKMSEEQNAESFPFDPSTLDAVILTHTHLDHIGRVPKLVREGFKGRIIATEPTAEFAAVMLEDSVHVLTMEAERHGTEPLYSVEDVQQVIPLLEGHPYHTSITIKDCTIELFDAGHILGSAIAKIDDGQRSVVFSGDLGNPPVPILKPTETIPEADYVVMESTYGGRVHEDKDTRTLLLHSAIYETVMLNGVLLIPAFAMERTQELLYEINTLVNNHDIPPVGIYVDSPLAIKATAIFKKFEQYFNTETQSIIHSGDDVFNFPELHMTATSDESKAINDVPAPKVIIAGSGMAHGGRIVHHIKRYIGNFATTYLIVGYQVNGSLGRKLLDGAKTVRIHGEDTEVHARVQAIGGYSAHADQPKLTAWITAFNQDKLKGIFLNHGEEDQATALQRHLEQHMKTPITIPEPLQQIELT